MLNARRLCLFHAVNVHPFRFVVNIKNAPLCICLTILILGLYKIKKQVYIEPQERKDAQKMCSLRFLYV